MKRLSLIALLSALVLVLLGTVGVAGASAKAQHTQFTGGIGIANPCNGETVSGTGPDEDRVRRAEGRLCRPLHLQGDDDRKSR